MPLRRTFAPLMALTLSAFGLCAAPVDHVARKAFASFSSGSNGSSRLRGWRWSSGKVRSGIAERIRYAGTLKECDALLASLATPPRSMSRRTLRRCMRNHARRRHELLVEEGGAKYWEAVEAKEGAAEAELVMAQVAANLPALSGTTPPTDIQWMPPGKHHIVATKGSGETAEMDVEVNAELAKVVQDDFVAMKARADRNEGDRPYFDFNHDDKEASGFPTEFYWGGDDPIKGGIRAKVEWSSAGSAAITGKTYRRFSPCFYASEQSGVYGVPVNMGGLVNRAAFQRIAPLSARAGTKAGDPANQPNKPNQKTDTMKALLAVLAKLGIITSSDLDEATAATQAQTNIGALQTERDNHKAKLGATETERDGFKTRAEKAEGDLKKAKKDHATSVVEAAVKEGRIPPQNEEMKAKWIGLIEADPTNASLLPEANPALGAEVVTAKGGEGQIVQPKGNGKEDPFIVAAKAHGVANKLTPNDALVDYAEKNPAGYEEYRKRSGLGNQVQG